MKHLLLSFILWIIFFLMGLYRSSSLLMALEVVGEADQKSYAISIDEAVSLSIENNFDIQLAKYDAWISRLNLPAAESVYDTILDAEIKHHDDQQKKSSTILGSKTLDNNYNFGLSKKLSIGTTVGVQMNNNRHWADSAFASAPLTHDSSLGMSLSQDLGKNFFGIRDRGEVKIAQTEIEGVEFTSLRKIEDYIAQVQRVYWGLVLLRERAQIEQKMLEQAKILHETHQKKLKVGLVENPEVIAAEANYRMRVEELTLAQNEVRSQGNILKLLLNLTEDSVSLEPKEGLTLPGLSEDFSSSLKKAFAYRRDYKKAVSDIQSRNIRLSLKQNNLWPEINLKASFERNGLGDHFKQAVSHISDEDNPEFFAGLTMSFPLENTKARSEARAAELEKAKSLLNVKYLERRIAVEIVDHVRNCRIFRQVAVGHQEIADLQELKWREEEKRFERGRSNTDILIRYQEEVIQARFLAAQSKHRYLLSLIDLRLAEGTLLDSYWPGEL